MDIKNKLKKIAWGIATIVILIMICLGLATLGAIYIKHWYNNNCTSPNNPDIRNICSNLTEGSAINYTPSFLKGLAK